MKIGDTDWGEEFLGCDEKNAWFER
jgi:hypothetical protein